MTPRLDENGSPDADTPRVVGKPSPEALAEAKRILDREAERILRERLEALRPRL